MTKQDEKLRQRRRLQTQAVEMAARNRWDEALEFNLQLNTLGEDTDTWNRLGKAYFETGKLGDARDSYQRALKMTPNNPIARKNLERIDTLMAREVNLTGAAKTHRQLVDLRLFITETGKTAQTSLIDTPRGPITNAIVTGEKVELRIDGKYVLVLDADGNVIGRIEPKLSQRLNQLMSGGNKYIAAVSQSRGGQIRILLREIHQDPSQRGRVSFPGKLSDGAMRGGYVGGAQFDDFGEDMMEDDDAADDRDEVEEESFGGEEEELGLDDIEQDITEDEEMGEE